MAVVVVDTSVLVAALRSDGGMSRRVVRACIAGDLQPVIGPALIAEYDDVFARAPLWQGCRVSAAERSVVLDAFLQSCRWVEVFYAWRPNLPDEADNHLVELALAGQAEAIVSKNLRDLQRGELKFPALRMLSPLSTWEKWLCQR